jgi:hypothetical protein
MKRLTPEEREAYWQQHGEAWRNGRREIALEDVVARGHTNNTTTHQQPQRKDKGRKHAE